ncbi:hypothetical protein ACFV1W_33380 [Kitasatospora sp. NPDC059648]|uniref:hypothetical protein n=1 Tax=Kitasatospora sp. NPDC059648 TaxID=3346894 RepID=UPI0036A84FA3
MRTTTLLADVAPGPTGGRGGEPVVVLSPAAAIVARTVRLNRLNWLEPKRRGPDGR